MGCLTWILFLAGAVLVMVSMIRWFEQATEAVELRWWNKVFVLLAMPFTVWLFPSRVAAGRPGMPLRHEPVRGFGALPKGGIVDPNIAPASADEPPAGTPPEFPVKHQAPPPKAKSAHPAVDPEKLAKLKQKMREQGMLPPDEQ